MLYTGVFNNIRGRHLGASAWSGTKERDPGNYAALQAAAGAFAGISSFPQGLNSDAAYRLAIKNGGMAAYIRNVADVSATVTSSATIAATILALANLDANINAGRFIAAALSGVADTDGELASVGILRAAIAIGAQPSATDIAESVINGVAVENGLSLRDVLRTLLAVAAGKTVITDLGGGEATVAFRDQADTKNRVEAMMAGSTRVDVDLDPA